MHSLQAQRPRSLFAQPLPLHRCRCDRMPADCRALLAAGWRPQLVHRIRDAVLGLETIAALRFGGYGGLGSVRLDGARDSLLWLEDHDDGKDLPPPGHTTVGR